MAKYYITQNHIITIFDLSDSCVGKKYNEYSDKITNYIIHGSGFEGYVSGS